MRATIVGTLLVVLVLGPGSAGAQVSQPNADVARGVQQVWEGEYEAAVLTLDGAVRALAGRPAGRADLLRAHLYLGVAYLGLDQPAKAQAAFAGALRLDPKLELDPKEFSKRTQLAFEAARAAAGLQPSLPPGPAVDGDALSCEALKTSRSAPAFEAYLKRFPNGVCAGLADVRLAELRGPQVADAQGPKPTPTPLPAPAPTPQPMPRPQPTTTPAPAVAGPAPVPGETGAGTVRTNPKDGLDYVWIPAGTFEMGCVPGDHDCERDEKPRHRVTISQGFLLGRTEVTVDAYKRFAPLPGGNHDGGYPVVNVSWNNAVTFCSWSGGRLPTEAQWEYAARGGVSGEIYPWTGASHDMVNYDGTGGRDVWDGVSPVASFPANRFGLHDMAGNVWEWVSDWYGQSYYAASPAADPTGPASGPGRVLRGGSWVSFPGVLRASVRHDFSPSYRSHGIGFRCVRDPLP